MKDKKDFNIPADLYYTREHIWARPVGNMLETGITDFAQDQLGGIVFIELPDPDQKYSAGDEFGSIESVKAVNSLFMPLSGTIESVNDSLDEAPEKINSSCYDAGWIAKIRPDNPAEINKLMDAQAYRKFLEQV